MTFFSYFVIATTVLVQIAYSAVHVVDCPDQQESCVCSDTAEVCEFTLRIEQRQTFLSYNLSNNAKRELTYDSSAYFLDENGYQPAENGSGTCRFENLRNDTDFTSRGCSIPMTVDGVSYRSFYAINGRTPGPTLVVSFNQTVVVRVQNYITSESISVHWHGLYQRNTPWMDGVGYITQPPIDPGATFDYIFKADPYGTFWYHSHVGTQRTNGIYGGLVIRERGSSDEPLPPNIDEPERYTLTLIDWQRESSQNLFIRLNSSLCFYPNKPALQVPTNQDTPWPGTSTSDGSGTGLYPFWSGLINGRGRFEDTITPLSIFSVSPGNSYRFRLIGTVAQYAYMFSIDGHTLTVVATDGRNVQPFEVDYIVLHAGERYDFLLNTSNSNDQPGYWMHAQTLEVNLTPGTDHSARAILTYEMESSLDWRNGYANVPEPPRQCSSGRQCKVLNCPYERFAIGSNMTCIKVTDLSLRERQTEKQLPKFPANPNSTHFLNFGFQGPNGDNSINARSFQLPTTAYTTNCDQYQNDLNDSTVNTCETCPEGESCRCVNVLPLAMNQVWDPDADEWETIVMVVSSITSPFAHPIHIHAHAYHVVYIGYGTYNEDGTLNETTSDIVCNERPCTNPRWANGIPEAVRSQAVNGRVNSSAIRKDTLILPAGGYVVIAFQANNPGYWFMHCHIEDHQLQGMILLLQEYTPEQHRAPPVDPDINAHGSFRWSVEGFNNFQNDALTCSDVTTTIAPNPESLNTIAIPRSGFGVMLAIIALFAMVCAVLIVVVIVLYVKRKSGRIEQNSTKEEIDLSTTAAK